MLDFGLRRLRELFPGAELHVFTSAPERLREINPDTIPYRSGDRKAWCRQRLIPRWPGRMGFANRWNHSRYDSVGRLKRPAVWESVHNAASWWPDEESQGARQFVEFMKTIDLVVATGSGGINDEFAYHAVMVLLMLHLARSMEIPVAMFGQGLGPVANPHLRKRDAAGVAAGEFFGVAGRQAWVAAGGIAGCAARKNRSYGRWWGWKSRICLRRR